VAGSVVSADGTVIGYKSLGEGPPLLLVHGSSATRVRWAPVRSRLAQRYTVCDIDRRGRGISTAEAGSYSLGREAEDVAAVATAVGGNVYVVGHSYGALCVMEAALITSAFRRMVLYEPMMPAPGLDVISPDALAQLKAMTDLELLLETFYREALQLPQSAINAMKGTEIWQARLTAAHTIFREFDQVNAYRATDRLMKIDVPVRMLLGTESPSHLRAATAAFAAQIPGATIVALHGQAHQAIDSDPEQFVHAVIDFDTRSAT
jgi:pimeloyl-ACP methyl ester carboxylesterase